MIKIYIKLFTLVVIFSSGCKEDNGISPPSYTPEELLGTWELKKGGPIYWKYLIISSDNAFYNLNSSEDNRHSIQQGTYRITDNEIVLWRRYTFSVSNDTLQLSEYGVVNILIKKDDAPSKDEWLIPVTILKEFTVPFLYDFTYDGSFFWGIGFDGVLKFDTLGNILSSYTIPTSGGIAFGSNRLWISNYDTIKSVNPATGEIISTLLLQSGNRIISLTYENGFLWAFDIINDRIFKINESSGAVVKFFKVSSILGFEFQGGKIWGIDANSYYDPSYLYTFDPANGKIEDTYCIPKYFTAWNSIAFDGKYMWAFFTNTNHESTMVKLNIPYTLPGTASTYYIGGIVDF